MATEKEIAVVAPAPAPQKPSEQLLEALAARALAEEKDEAKKRARSKGFETIAAKVDWDGTRIVLPKEPYKMSYAEAKDWLTRLEADEEKEIGIYEEIDAFPLDGAVAFMKAMQRTYGWASPQPTPGFFGPKPPTMVAVEISVTEKAQIIWGHFKVPGIDGVIQTDVTEKHGRMIFCIRGKVKKKYLPAVHELAELTRQIVRAESIYRSKALRLYVLDDGRLNLNEPPTFIDVSRANPDELVFSAELMEQVRTNLYTPIERSTQCRKYGIPLKRGVLLEGPYGTGKTLCAHVVARKCEENGWTFVTVDRVTALKAALDFAKLYQPCVIFVEDIDREVAGERTPEMDDILNVVDGVVSKGTELMVVLTSNEAEKINRAMLRPGRLDAVLHIDAPDADAAEKLMRLYGRGLIHESTPLTEAKKELSGQIPAVIREAVERAKLFAISRGAGDSFGLVDSDIARAAKGMKRHLDLLRGPAPDTATAEHKLGASVVELVGKALTNGGPTGLFARVQDIARAVGAGE